MKVLFVYCDVNSSEPARYACGLGALSAYIKKHGHDTHLSYIKTEADYAILRKKINVILETSVVSVCTQNTN